MLTGQKLDTQKPKANTAKASHLRLRCLLSAMLSLAAMASVAASVVTWGPITEDSHFDSLRRGCDLNCPGCYLEFAVYALEYEIGENGYADVKGTNPAFGEPCTIYRRRADGKDGGFKAIATIYSGYDIWNQFIDYDVVPGVEYTYYVSIDRDSLDQHEKLVTPYLNVLAANTYRAEISKTEVSFDADSGECEIDVAIYEVTPSESRLVTSPDIRTTLLKNDYITHKHEEGDGIITSTDNYNLGVWVDYNDTGAPREWLVYVGLFVCYNPAIPLECGTIRVKQAAKKEDAVSVDTGTGSVVSVPKTWLS